MDWYIGFQVLGKTLSLLSKRGPRAIGKALVGCQGSEPTLLGERVDSV